MKHQRSKISLTSFEILFVLHMNGFVNDYSYVFSLRNFTRIILQGIGSQKIGSVAFRDSWALIHHHKTNINYNFEEVIIVICVTMMKTSE